MKIRPVKPYFGNDDIDFVLSESKNILEGNGKLTQGKFVKRFETEFSDYIGTKHAVSTNSCTTALDAIFKSLDIVGKEVIVPTNTFAASAYGVIHAGGIPVFADIDKSMNMNLKSIIENITDDTVGVIVVHMGGYITPKIDEIIDICESKNLFLIEDAAHGHGCSIDGTKAGQIGLAAAFSFYSTKVMTTGEGGMITTNDSELFEKASIIINQGKMPKEKIPVGEGIYQNWQEFFGHNFRMTEFSALMGITQLNRLDSFVENRTKTAEQYYEKLSSIDGLELLPISDRVVNNYYKIFCFTDEKINRIKMYKDLKEKGVSLGGMTYEIPLHLIPAFKKFSRKSLPTSEYLCENHMPTYLLWNEVEEIDRVCSLLDEWLNENR